MTFLSTEKKRYRELKADRILFSATAQEDGPYSQSKSAPTYAFCLPGACATENLLPDIRKDVVAEFQARQIPWHRGWAKGHEPTTHLCSSQVACVNFLRPLADHPRALLRLVKTVFPSAIRMMPVVADGTPSGGLVEFEWIGRPAANYLSEGVGRRRGANNTSADAAVCFETTTGSRHLVLVEWKYCEKYNDLEKLAGKQLLAAGDSGKTRRRRYSGGLPSILRPGVSITVDMLMVEPFYQFMRQQLLAEELRAAGEADEVSVLHLSPVANSDFKRVTIPSLRDAADATSAWKALLRHPESFEARGVEDCFSPLLARPEMGLKGWRDLLVRRYPWVAQ